MNSDSIFPDHWGLNEAESFAQSSDFPSFPFSANDGSSTLPYVDQYVTQNVVMKSFSGIDARYIAQNYFNGAKSLTVNETVSIIHEVECDKDVLITELKLIVNSDKLSGYKPNGKDSLIAQIYIFISRNGNKLHHLYGQSERGIGKKEIYFFLEDNTGDYSNQVLYARFGTEKLRQDLLTTGDSLERIYSLVPGLNRDLLKDLIRNGKIEAKPSLLRTVIFGAASSGIAYLIVPKAIGWVLTKIGDSIADNLKIPEKIWDSRGEDYFLDKNNLIKELQLDTEFSNTINEVLKKNNPFVQILMGPLGAQMVESNVELVTRLIQQHNVYIETFVDDIYNRYQSTIAATDFIFNHSEALAFYCGLWNGLVDFIADIFKFAGLILETPSDLIHDFQYFLEALDNFLDALKRFSILDIFSAIIFVQSYVLEELIKFVKSDNIREEYNIDKIAYYTGYAVGFIVSLFVPSLNLAHVTKIAKIGNIAKVNRTIPDDYLVAIAKKNSEVPSNTTQLSKLLNDLAEFLGNKAKGQRFNDEIKAVLDESVHYVKKNADEFKKPAVNMKRIKKMWDDFNYDDLMKIPPAKKPCFLAGTLVKSEDGLIAIEKVKIGLKVYAYNFESEKSELKSVTQTYRNITDKYICIETKSGFVKATGQHRFWIVEKQAWIMANSLQVGMNFLDVKGNLVSIISLEIKDETANTYNLEVEDHHNYFVGDNHILSHNKTRNSIFASTEFIEAEFYRIVQEIGENITSLYVGQTKQGYSVRYTQHRADIKKAHWRSKMSGVLEIQINGKSGPFKMTPYEAAVVELYEINSRGGVRKGNKGLYNKQKPIGMKKFDYFKKHGTFNPCKYYV